MGKPASLREIPYFFSDQYDVGIEYSGYAADWDEVVFRGDRASREFLAFWLKDSRVVAGMNMNVWDVHDEIRELIRSRRQVSRVDLADAEIPLSVLGLGVKPSRRAPRRLAPGHPRGERFDPLGPATTCRRLDLA